MDHLALKVSDRERARRFYESHCGSGAKPARRYDGRRRRRDGRAVARAQYVSGKLRDPDGRIVELSWKTT